MKKIFGFALVLSATVLLACPMQGGMMGKCQCDTNLLPKPFEALGLSDTQKEQIKQLREESKAFHNKQHEKMMAILTPEQQAKLDAVRPMNGKKCKMAPIGMKSMMQNAKTPDKDPSVMPGNGMGCKNCPQEPTDK